MSVQKYIDSLHEAKLTPEEFAEARHALIAAKAADKRLVKHYMPLVVELAKARAPKESEMRLLHLIQDGNLALIRILHDVDFAAILDLDEYVQRHLQEAFKKF
jgi:DNA-directed RNA polymerase sigma subunit (sigma70/sigma32)